jgi:hypothetical protein
MSLFDDASLVMIPSAYKDGKLYSIKPTDGSGDFTFSRGSNLAATRVNSSGLIEKGRENLLLQSNSFTSTWNVDTGVTFTSGQSGYDGSNNAWKFDKTASQFLAIRQTPTYSGVVTFSIYAKEGTLRYLNFYHPSSTAQIWFDLQAGAVGWQGGAYIENKIEDVGSGWYRCSVTYNASSGGELRIYPSSADVAYTAVAGNIYIQNAQLERGLVATDYIETTTTTAQAGILEDMARLDYSGGASCPSLKLEPQRTNLIVNSEYLTGTAGTSTFNEITSPEGVDNGLLFVEDTATTTHGFLRPATIPTNASAVNYTISIFAKKKEREYIQLTFFAEGVSTSSSGFNLINGTTSGDSATHKIEDYGNGWYRCSFTASILQSTGAYNFSRVGTGSNEFTFYYAGDGTSGMYFYGFQVESGSLTSYIPTYGTNQTRSKDSCIKTGISSLIGQTEGTLFAEFEIPVNTQNGDIIAIRNGTSSANGIFVSYRSSSVVQLIVRTGSTNALIFQRIGSYPSGKNKIAVAYKNGDFAISLNGTAAQVNTSSITMPTSLDSVALFGDNLYAQTLPVPYAQVLLFKTRLTNAELADLTTI